MGFQILGFFYLSVFSIQPVNFNIISKPFPVLVVDELTKQYGNFLAVDHVSFCVESNECFGVLGPNGAGKTSTFKMLTGEHDISAGQARVRN